MKKIYKSSSFRVILLLLLLFGGFRSLAKDFSINYDNKYNVPFVGSPEIYFKWDINFNKKLASNYIAKIEYNLVDTHGKNIFTQKGTTQSSSFTIYCSIKNINNKKDAPVFWIKHFPMRWAESKLGLLPSQFMHSNSVLFSIPHIINGNFAKSVELFQSRLPQPNDEIKKSISTSRLEQGNTSILKLIDKKNTVQILYTTHGIPECNLNLKLFIKINIVKPDIGDT